jgi:hypothetical protein
VQKRKTRAAVPFGKLKDFQTAYAAIDLHPLGPLDDLPDAVLDNEAVRIFREIVAAADSTNPRAAPSNELQRVLTELHKLTELNGALKRGEQTMARVACFSEVASFLKGELTTASIKAARRHLGIRKKSIELKMERRLNGGKPRAFRGDIVKLFKQSRKRALEALLPRDTVQCEVSGDTIHAHFAKANAGNASVPPGHRVPFDISAITSIPSIAASQPRPCTPEEDAGAP